MNSAWHVLVVQIRLQQHCLSKQQPLREKVLKCSAYFTMSPNASGSVFNLYGMPCFAHNSITYG
jgi:hypothetical protein